MKKAFDRVGYAGLIHFKANSGIGKLLARFQNYLSDRKQRVMLPDVFFFFPDLSKILTGVPQGTSLELLLFLVYNSDIIKDIHTNIRSFPDTSILIIIVKDLVTSVDRLNEDLEKLLKNGRTLADVVYSTVTESRIICRKINTHLYMNTHIYLKLNAQA